MTRGMCDAIKDLGLFMFVAYLLKTGTGLIIDEMENHFYKILVEILINLYMDKLVNKNKVTLIFTTHYCEILDLFNRGDNIHISKFQNEINLENMYEKYKFYSNEFNANVSYEALMNFKKELMIIYYFK